MAGVGGAAGIGAGSVGADSGGALDSGVGNVGRTGSWSVGVVVAGPDATGCAARVGVARGARAAGFGWLLAVALRGVLVGAALAGDVGAGVGSGVGISAGAGSATGGGISGAVGLIESAFDGAGVVRSARAACRAATKPPDASSTTAAMAAMTRFFA